jgi:hypothetical protein
MNAALGRYSYWTWWINRFPSANPLRAGLFVMVQIEEAIFSWKEAPSDFFCWPFLHPPHSMTRQLHLAVVALKRKPESRGKQAPRAPSIVGSFSPQPWLESAGDSVAPDVCHFVLAAAQASPAAIHGGATSVIVRSPPLQMGQEMGRLLCCGPGPASQSGQAMTDRQIHPLDKSRVQPSREA